MRWPLTSVRGCWQRAGQRVKPEKGADSLRQILQQGAEALERGGIESPVCESEWILCSLLGRARAELYLSDPEVTSDTVAAFRDLIRQRVEREPIQYLLREAHFFGRRFSVGPGVFIPRP